VLSPPLLQGTPIAFAFLLRRRRGQPAIESSLSDGRGGKRGKRSLISTVLGLESAFNTATGEKGKKKKKGDFRRSITSIPATCLL